MNGGIFTLAETLAPIGIRDPEKVPYEERRKVTAIGFAFSAFKSALIVSKISKGDNGPLVEEEHFAKAKRGEVTVMDNLSRLKHTQTQFGLHQYGEGYVVDRKNLAAGLAEYSLTMRAKAFENIPGVAEALNRALLNEVVRRNLPVIFSRATLHQVEDHGAIVRMVFRGYTLHEPRFLISRPVAEL